MAKLTGNNLKYVAERLVSLSKYGTQWLGVKGHTKEEAKEAASRIAVVYGGVKVSSSANGWLANNTYWVKFADGSTRLNTFNDIQTAVAKYLEENEVQTGSDETPITPDTTYEEPLVEENTGNESKADGNTKTLLIIAGIALVVIVLVAVLFRKED